MVLKNLNLLETVSNGEKCFKKQICFVFYKVSFYNMKLFSCVRMIFFHVVKLFSYVFSGYFKNI